MLSSFYILYILHYQKVRMEKHECGDDTQPVCEERENPGAGAGDKD